MLPAEKRHHGLHYFYHCKYIHFKTLLNFFFVQFFYSSANTITGIVYHYIYLAKMINCLLNGGGYFSGAAQVYLQRQQPFVVISTHGCFQIIYGTRGSCYS